MDDVFPNWGVLQHGCSVNVVLQILLVESKSFYGRTVSMPSQKVLVRGEIPKDFGSTVVLLNAKVVEVSPVPLIEVGNATGFYSIPHCSTFRQTSGGVVQWNWYFQ